MDSPSINELLQRLDGWIFDENKLVTYKLLSRLAQINVNHAKWLLIKYLQLHCKTPLPDFVLKTLENYPSDVGNVDLNTVTNQEKCDFIVVYCISGNKADSGMYQIEIIRDKDLEGKMKSYASPVSCHVYSIIKGKCGLASNALYIADFDVTRENILKSSEYSSIVCDRAVIQTKDTSKAKIQQEVKQESKPDLVENKSTGAKEENKSTKQTAKTSFFGNAKPGTSSGASSKAPEKPSKVETVPDKPTKSFFGAQADKQKSPANSAASTDKNKTAVTNGNKNAAKSSSSTSASGKDKKNKQDKQPNKKDAEDEKTLSKKRKRVLDLSSSDEDDDDDFEKMELERMNLENCDPQQNTTDIPAPPAKQEDAEIMETEDVKEDASEKISSSTIVTKTNRRLVSKTFQNEEGFMVTEKVWETVTTTEELEGGSEQHGKDDGDKESSKPEVPGGAKKGAAAPAVSKGGKKGGKAAAAASKQQTAMTSFFKKK